MNQSDLAGKRFFFCGIGGSGMAPLALIVAARGAHVAGSDRAFDQQRNLDKARYLQDQGITLHPQDGTGLSGSDQTLVISTAVEPSIPDVKAALDLGAPIVKRAELLSRLFNGAGISIGVAGTSGKSTTTGMIAHILSRSGRAPTVMNGAEMKSFASADTPFASALIGEPGLFVSEIDESDGSIAHYRPHIAVVTNISLDHKPMSELRPLFADYLARANHQVLNLDNDETRALVGPESITFAERDPGAHFHAADVALSPASIAFTVLERAGSQARVSLPMPGLHNLSNALAAIAAARACGVALADACAALGDFGGIRRRLDVIGERGGITVIDDFAHNPDKIAATLRTLHDFPGRLLLMFQPHGYGPLRQLAEPLVETFAAHMQPGDALVMPEPVYYGGTTDRSVGSSAVTEPLAAHGLSAHALQTREACADWLVQQARAGDRIVIMGARDDTLPAFARSVLDRLAPGPAD